MRNKLIVILVVALLAIMLPASTVFAQGATSQTWTSSITYYTPSATGGTLQVDYYAPNGTVYQANSIVLQPHKAGSLFIGNVSSVPTPFAGSAVLSSEVPVVATYVQFATDPNTAKYGRLLYSGFTADDAGTPFYVPTVLYGNATSTTSRIGVQNIESFAINANLKFYAVGQTTPTAEKTVLIPPQSSYIFLASDITGLSVGFSGSLVIAGSKSDAPATPGRVVAAAEETSNSGRTAYAFEGVAQGANKVYMASMLCKNGLSEQQTSYYAIQNASATTKANVTVKAFKTDGTQVANQSLGEIQPGGKLSTNPCEWGVVANTSGSAVIESTGGTIIAIAKVIANNGLATAFNGQAAGNTKIAAPYVRWAADPNADFRTFVAIMNVGSASAQNIVVTYYDGNGLAVATKTLASAANPLGQYVKRNTDPQSAAALNATYNDFGFHPSGGAIEIQSDQPVVVVLRNLRGVIDPTLAPVTTFGEDYNGSPIP